jgi:hypothetical protein
MLKDNKIIHFCSFFFLGQVTIEFYVEKEANFIVLHAQDLNITEKVNMLLYFLFFYFNFYLWISCFTVYFIYFL